MSLAEKLATLTGTKVEAAKKPTTTKTIKRHPYLVSAARAANSSKTPAEYHAKMAKLHDKWGERHDTASEKTNNDAKQSYHQSMWDMHTAVADAHENIAKTLEKGYPDTDNRQRVKK